MNRVVLSALSLAAPLALAACDKAQDLDQTGPRPTLPEQNQTLLPPMKIASPSGWNGGMPNVPKGFAIWPIATGLKMPRQTLALPNCDILVSEGVGASAPKLRPKDVIAGYIKSLGKSGTKGGDRIILLRDRDGDGKYELQTVLIDKLNALYDMALVGADLYIAIRTPCCAFPIAAEKRASMRPGKW